MLDAERLEQLRTRSRSERHVRHDRSILLASLHDVARLEEEPLVGSVLDLELVDFRPAPAGRGSFLTYRDRARGEPFVERDVVARVLRRPADDVHRKILVSKGAFEREP